MKILAIDTACDETSAAVTQGTKVLSNIVWSQASLHAKWGGILPSLAQREHIKRIDWVIQRALRNAKCQIQDVNAIAVTVGPCLAVAGQVGIKKAKELSKKYKKPLIAVNHLEGHILSPLATPKTTKKRAPSGISFPALGVVASGGHTDLVLIKKIGSYKLLAKTGDDALGEALDKGARMLGLGYPGGAILEKMAQKGKVNSYPLPLPMSGREKEGLFSYSGLKTAMWKIVEREKIKNRGFLSKVQIENLAGSFQNKAFEHLIRVVSVSINQQTLKFKDLLFGGGVSNNLEVRKRLRRLGGHYHLKIRLPYTKELCGDNAAMIGVAAFFKAKRNEFEKNPGLVERIPRLSLEDNFPWEN